MDKSNPLLIPMFQDLSNGILRKFEPCSLHAYLFKDFRLLKDNSQVDYHLEMFGFSSFALENVHES
jgi:hypothetical protein